MFGFTSNLKTKKHISLLKVWGLKGIEEDFYETQERTALSTIRRRKKYLQS